MNSNCHQLVWASRQLKEAPQRVVLSDGTTTEMVADQILQTLRTHVSLPAEVLNVFNYLIDDERIHRHFALLYQHCFSALAELIESEPYFTAPTNLRVKILRKYFYWKPITEEMRFVTYPYEILARLIKSHFLSWEKPKVDPTQALLLSLDEETLQFIETDIYHQYSYSVYNLPNFHCTHNESINGFYETFLASLDIWGPIFREKFRFRGLDFCPQLTVENALEKLFFMENAAIKNPVIRTKDSVLKVLKNFDLQNFSIVFDNGILTGKLATLFVEYQASEEVFEFLKKLRCQCREMNFFPLSLYPLLKTITTDYLNSSETYVKGLTLNYSRNAVLLNLPDCEKSRLWGYVMESHDFNAVMLLAMNSAPDHTVDTKYIDQYYGVTHIGFSHVLCDPNLNLNQIKLIIAKYQEQNHNWIWSPLEHLLNTQWTWDTFNSSLTFIMKMTEYCGAGFFGNENGFNREGVPNFIAYGQEATRIALRIIRCIHDPLWPTEIDDDLLRDVFLMFREKCCEDTDWDDRAYETAKDRKVRELLKKLVFLLMFSLQVCDEADDEIFSDFAALCITYLLTVDPKLALMLSVALNRSLLKLNGFQQRSQPGAKYTGYHWDSEYTAAKASIQSIFSQPIGDVLQEIASDPLSNPYIYELEIMSRIQDYNLKDSDEFCHWMVIRNKLRAQQENANRIR